MKISEKKLENATIELEIELPADLVNSEYEEVFKKMQKTVKVDGFRKGKAPIQIVETKFLEHANQEVAEQLLQKGFLDAVTEKQYTPIARPNYSFDSIARDEIFSFKAVFEIPPTVTIEKYKDISVEEKDCKINDNDVQDEIDALRERDAKITKKEDGAVIQNNDLAKIKVKRIDDIEKDKQDSAEYKDYSIVVGKSKDSSALDKHIVGMKVGEEKDVDVKYPKDYYIEDLSGQKVTYSVKIEEISDMELPELNDDFAKKLEFESVPNMIEKTKENIENFVKEKIRGEAKAEILKNIVETSTFDIPETMVLQEMGAKFNNYQQRIGYQVESIEQFAAMFGMSEEEFKGKLREESLQSIKTTLVLSEIARIEEMKVDEDKYKEIVETIAKRNNKTLEEIEELIEKNNSRENIESEIILDQSMDFLYENAKVKKLKAMAYDEFMRSVS